MHRHSSDQDGPLPPRTTHNMDADLTGVHIYQLQGLCIELPSAVKCYDVTWQNCTKNIYNETGAGDLVHCMQKIIKPKVLNLAQISKDQIQANSIQNQLHIIWKNISRRKKYICSLFYNHPPL